MAKRGDQGLHEAIDRLLRQQTDQGDLIETLWQLYGKAVEIPPGGTQWVESRRAFFAGAATLFEAINRVLDEDREPTDADVARMERIAKELRRYYADLEQRLG